MPSDMNSLPHSCETETEAPYSFMRKCPSLARWVEFWCIDCAEESTCDPADVLSKEEITRAQAYRSNADSRAFIRRRAALRALIGRWLKCEPEAVRFSSNAYGKPLLAWPSTGEVLSFSVAHTTGIALLAIAQCESIGVDIERVRHDLDFLCVGRVAFAESELAWMTACDRNEMADRFFRLWTRKEAYLKALGWGFLRDPRMFVPAAIDEEARNDGVHATAPWVPKSGDLFELPLGRLLRGAFAVG
jgi:4'-phosphopantetheinyl transferase